MPESFFGWIGFLIKEYGSLFLEGTLNTIIIAVIGTLIGFLIGLLIAIIRTIKVNKKSSAFKRGLLKVVNAIITVYIQVIRGTPMMVQAMMFYYGSLQYFNLNMAAMPSALIIVSVNTGAYMAEIIRGGIYCKHKVFFCFKCNFCFRIILYFKISSRNLSKILRSFLHHSLNLSSAYYYSEPGHEAYWKENGWRRNLQDLRFSI